MSEKPSTVRAMLEQEEEHITEILASISAVGMVLGPKNYVIYSSCAITTGKRMYDLMKELGIDNVDTLKQQYKENYVKHVVAENSLDGRVFANELRSLTLPAPWNAAEQINPDVISPSEYMQRSWTDKIYMAMWDQIITKYANEVCFNRNPFYSTGQAEEFYIGVREGKILTQRDGHLPMDPRRELEHFEEAIDDIADTIKQIPEKLYDIYRKTVVSIKG
jgi:hypothetical protein